MRNPVRPLLSGTVHGLRLSCEHGDEHTRWAMNRCCRWFAEAERVHSRWAMLAVAGILAQVCGPGRPSYAPESRTVNLYISQSMLCRRIGRWKAVR